MVLRNPGEYKFNTGILTQTLVWHLGNTNMLLQDRNRGII